MFRFKRFSVSQEHTPMKVGTDGVLVGAWAEVRPGDQRMLDIGTGTGLIALMLAQRTEAAGAGGARITGVDVEELTDAEANAAASPWAGRIRFVRCPVQAFGVPAGGGTEEGGASSADRTGGVSGAEQYGFDLIVSNPPFFVDSLTCPDRGRTAARHAVLLPFGELRDAVCRLLAPGGRFAVILPVEEGRRFAELCRGQLTLRRMTTVRTTPYRAPKRVLMEFAPADALRPDAVPVCDSLVVGTGRHEEYTAEYRALTRDFYLKF